MSCGVPSTSRNELRFLGFVDIRWYHYRMPILDIQTLNSAQKKNSRLLGLDLGTKTIGLALSDSLWTIASPYRTIARTKLKKDLEQLKREVEEHSIQGFILGLPLNMDGSEGPRCQATRQFATDLLKYMEIDLVFWDERLSTSAVETMMIEADLTRKRRAELVDKLAASYILQGVLDAMKLLG